MVKRETNNESESKNRVEGDCQNHTVCFSASAGSIFCFIIGAIVNAGGQASCSRQIAELSYVNDAIKIDDGQSHGEQSNAKDNTTVTPAAYVLDKGLEDQI